MEIKRRWNSKKKEKKKNPDTKSTEPRVYTELFQRAHPALIFFFSASSFTNSGWTRLPSRIYSEISQKAALNNKTHGAAQAAAGNIRRICVAVAEPQTALGFRAAAASQRSRGTPGTLRNGCDERASGDAPPLLLLRPPRTLNTHEK